MNETLELRLSLIVCLGLSGVYMAYALLAEPSGGQPFGHWLGIIGTVLMVATETLYSIRKRTSWLKWAGPVRYWLSAHIFTGLVGPFLVLLHTAFEFRGLAGFTLALTALVVASGFLGRYLYTAIPHSVAGVESSASDLIAALGATQAALGSFIQQHSPALQTLVATDTASLERARGDVTLVVLRGWDDWRYRRDLRRSLGRLQPSESNGLHEVETLLLERHRRDRQYRMLQSARRLLSIWHIVHVPMGVALFSSVFIHVAAVLYFGAAA
jgi:hypothetical protein